MIVESWMGRARELEVGNVCYALVHLWWLFNQAVYVVAEGCEGVTEGVRLGCHNAVFAFLHCTVVQV